MNYKSEVEKSKLKGSSKRIVEGNGLQKVMKVRHQK